MSFVLHMNQFTDMCFRKESLQQDAPSCEEEEEEEVSPTDKEFGECVHSVFELAS